MLLFVLFINNKRTLENLALSRGEAEILALCIVLSSPLSHLHVVSQPYSLSIPTLSPCNLEVVYAPNKHGEKNS